MRFWTEHEWDIVQSCHLRCWDFKMISFYLWNCGYDRTPKAVKMALHRGRWMTRREGKNWTEQESEIARRCKLQGMKISAIADELHKQGYSRPHEGVRQHVARMFGRKQTRPKVWRDANKELLARLSEHHGDRLS